MKVLLTVALLAAALPLGFDRGRDSARTPVLSGPLVSNATALRANGCLMKLTNGGQTVGISCSGTCAEIGCGATVSHGQGWVSCPCYTSTSCAGFYNTDSGQIACLRNDCADECTQESVPPPPGGQITPCLCL